MEVKSGDLIHADRHGAVIVPADKIDAMQPALDGLMKQEARIIAAARAPGATRREHQGRVPGLGEKIDNSALEDQTGRRAVSEQPPLMIRDPSLGSSDTAAAAQDDAFCLDQTCLRRDGPQE